VNAAILAYEHSFDDEQATVLAQAQSNPLLLPVGLGVLVLVLAVLVLFDVQVFVLRPLVRLRDAALAVAAGDRTRQVVAVARDEIGDLGRAFNTMISRVATQQQATQERTASLEQSNAAQAQLLATIQALDVPVIPVGDGVLALPLVGAVNKARAANLTTRLLETIYRERADVVILDVTGLATADEQAAHFLLDTAQQAALLGAQVVLTGIRADLARQMALLDLDLSSITVRATLREAIAEILAARHTGT
jgi:rsbT co-antagonist protein RsbR